MKIGAAEEPLDLVQRSHRIQRAIGILMAPLWVPVAPLVLRFGFGYRIVGMKSVRREFRRIQLDSSAPLLLCANHLTLIDSFIIAWALSPVWRYLVDFDSLPWNTPEETNFANTWRNRVLAYLAKCIPIRRGGSRDEVALVLARVQHLLARGELALLFPEGGRSRSGRVESGSGAWGVGRIVGGVPGCRVLCIYMRGAGQETFGDYPAKGERLHIALACIEPKSDSRGARRSRDLADQIVTQLRRMEERHFDDRQ